MGNSERKTSIVCRENSRMWLGVLYNCLWVSWKSYGDNYYTSLSYSFPSIYLQRYHVHILPIISFSNITALPRHWPSFPSIDTMEPRALYKGHTETIRIVLYIYIYTKASFIQRLSISIGKCPLYRDVLYKRYYPILLHSQRHWP